jgi:hypothetical protein
MMCEPQYYCHLQQDPQMMQSSSSLNVSLVKVILSAEKQQCGGLAEYL